MKRSEFGGFVASFAENNPSACGSACGASKPEQYRAVLDTCWKKYMEYGDGCKTTFNLKDHLWGLYLYEIGHFKIPEGLDDDTIYDGCNCGHGHFTILPNGDMMACRRFESKVGNLFETPLYDLWTSTQMDYYRHWRPRSWVSVPVSISFACHPRPSHPERFGKRICRKLAKQGNGWRRV